MKPEISVIVPACNAEATVRQTIESVLVQTFQNFELIVIDDGSTDHTAESLRNIQDERVRIFSYPNGGVSEARNRGMALAAGEFFSFLDADDLWTPTKLELQLAVLRNNPNAGVAYSWTCIIDQSGDRLFAKDRCFFEGDVYARLLVDNFVASGSNLLIRREAAAAAGAFDPSLSSAADWDYWVRLSAESKFALVPEYQIYYRQWSGSISSDPERVLADCTAASDKMFRSVPARLQFLKGRSQAFVLQYVAWLYARPPAGTGGIDAAMRLFLQAVRVCPDILWDSHTMRLMALLFVRRILPDGLVEHLTKSYGRFQQVSRKLAAPVARQGMGR